MSLVADFSIEMTGKDIPALRAAQHIIPLGTKVNITYLGSEDPAMRVVAAKTVKDLGFVPVPHIAARRIGSRAELEDLLRRLQDVGATERVFVVGGDPAEPEGPYSDAMSLISTGLLERYGAREVGVAGYPEPHPDISTDVLDRHLDDKLAALKREGLDALIVTQFAFDVDPVLAWIRRVRDRGIESQIRIGTPGPAGIKRLIGFARRFGVGANTMIVKKYGFSLTNLMGTAGPDRFIDELSQHLGSDPSTGDVKLHLYTFGGLLATSEWARDYRAAQL